jgi:hypothetical protein
MLPFHENVGIKKVFSYLNLGVGIGRIGVGGIRKSAVGEGKAGDHRGNSGGGRGGSRGLLIGGPPPPGLACRYYSVYYGCITRKRTRNLYLY